LLPPPLKGREYHFFCSPFNAGAKELAAELKDAPVFVTTGKKVSAPLTHTSDPSKIASCDHMLVLLDERTWTSGEDTANFVEHIHEAMRLGVHLNCVHEFPAVVGPPRHECEFGLMFGDDWTPAHLTGGKTNLYKEIALALKGSEWRKPGFVAFAGKTAASAAAHAPIDVKVPDSYEPAVGPNKWKSAYATAGVALAGGEPLPVTSSQLPQLPADCKAGIGTLTSSVTITPPEAPAADVNETAELAPAPAANGPIKDLSDRLKGMFTPESAAPASLDA